MLLKSYKQLLQLFSMLYRNKKWQYFTYTTYMMKENLLLNILNCKFVGSTSDLTHILGLGIEPRQVYPAINTDDDDFFIFK